MTTISRSIVGLLMVALGFLPSLSTAAAGDITIAAANSTCDALRKVGTAFSERHGVGVTYICKSSGLLANGLKGGAIKADYYISASKEWMDKAVEAGLVEQKEVRSLWSNVLVVAAPRSSTLTLDSWEKLDSPSIKQILIGDPSTAPFGRYAKQAMETSGLWAKVRPRIATAKNIALLAQTLAAAEEGSVGILFATSLVETLRPLVRVPVNRHDSIRYYSGPLKGRGSDGAVAAFMAFLDGASGDKIFHEAGFEVLP